MPEFTDTPLDHATLVEQLRNTWLTTPRTPRRQPIAESEDDRESRLTTNPLWDIVRWMPAKPPRFGPGRLEPQPVPLHCAPDEMRRLANAGAGRHDLTSRYAWSIISPGDIAWITRILDGRSVVEIGAGTGYWAWQLEQAGVDMAAYDPNPPAADNTYCKHGPYTTVLPDDASAAAKHPDRALLMVWPPYGGSHARHALSVYQGDLLIYAGEGPGGCTADDDFYSLLDAEWTELAVSPHHTTWWGIHCRLAAYQRGGAQ